MKKNSLKAHMAANYFTMGACLPIGILSTFASFHALANEEADAAADEPAIVEEVLTIGKFKSAAENVSLERKENEVIGDIIGSDLISRVGDSNVAAALGRLPGITVVDDQFVFVRGLGERDSSSTLNGAVVPSPDLSRNVIPLDIFPTSIVKSVSVQKAYSADMPAQFGGGSVDIRTRGIPDGLVFEFEIGSGVNSEQGDYITYDGGSDGLGSDDGTRALSPVLTSALNSFEGEFDTRSIQKDLGSDSTQAQAEEINRQLATELYRDIGIYEIGGRKDIDVSLTTGNVFELGSSTEFGFLSGISYDSKWSNADSFSREVGELVTGEPEEVDYKSESNFNVSITGNLSLGLDFNGDHKLETTSVFIRNTDDKTSITNSFDNDLPVTQSIADRGYKIRYEQRQVRINQVHGEHNLGALLVDQLNLNALSFASDIEATWFYSNSTSVTNIPNEVAIGATVNLENPEDRDAISSTVVLNDSAADYRFTYLDDEVESFGWNLNLPLNFDNSELVLDAGGEYWEKSRTYRQLQFALGTADSDAISSLNGYLSGVFSDENILNEDFGYAISVAGSNSESYIAVNKVNAFFGKADWTIDDTWRISAGLRWEDYQQVGLQWDPIDYEGSQILTTELQGQDAVIEELNNAVYTDDDIYPSVSFTYMKPDFWAEEFQLRFGYGGTTVRPDLREISKSSYIDPITGIRVFGDPDVLPAKYDNFDIRAEWFFNNGDNFTLSAYYKEIENPIDQRELPASDDFVALGITNRDSATVQGIELEFVASLDRIHEDLTPFFVQGNFTIQDTETEDQVGSIVSVRPLYGASDYIANLILGFDSDNGEHAATLSLNAFSERLYFSGINADTYQTPSTSLNMTYYYYPTDSLTIKLKAKNLLDENVELEDKLASRDVKTFSETVGRSFSVSAKYKF